MFSIICNEDDFIIIKIRDNLYALDGAGKRRVKLVDTIRADDYDPSELNDAINQVSDYDFVGEIEGFNKFGFWKTIEGWDPNEMSDDMKALITNIIVYGKEHFKGEDLAVFLYRILDGTIDFSE